MADFKLVEIIDASGKPLRSQMIVDGYRINTFGKLPEETANIVRNIVNLPIRDDDVFLGSFPKSGIGIMKQDKINKGRNCYIRAQLDFKDINFFFLTFIEV